jgi:hypothetical protein
MQLSPQAGIAENRTLRGLGWGIAPPWLVSAWLVALFLASQACGQVVPPGSVLARSHSGQFLVQGRPFGSLPGISPNLSTNQNLLSLDPTLVTVSCERIKQLLWRELGTAGGWNGKIFLSVYPANAAGDPISLTSERFRDGWQYRIELPSLIDRPRYVRAIVNALLLEMANRSTTGRSAEIPLWLSEGLTQGLLASEAIEIILAPPRPAPDGVSPPATFVIARKENPLVQVHKNLCARPSLSFQQLSWPAPNQFDGADGVLYGSSAQLFVSELLRLKSGPACLRAMLAELPRHYNWQFAFLQAFNQHFQRPLDVEKWWTLQLVHFTGRELAQTWPVDESWQKLDALISSKVQVHAQTNELPLQAEVTLQKIIREWDSARQTRALSTKLHELEQLRLRLAPELIPLADSYQQALRTYLEARDHTGGFIPFRKNAARRHAAAEAVAELNILDQRRIDARPASKSSATVQASSRPVP